MRAGPEGGKLLSPSIFHGLLDAQARRNCLVLVHGFNNTDSEAAAAYFDFRTREKEIFHTPDFSSFEARFGDAFWPGDADSWSFLDKLDFLIYPVSVHTAVKAARELVSLLSRMPNLEEVSFIGHSLGCRVVLEAASLLQLRTAPRIASIVLMAAAVPSEMLEQGGKFYDLLGELAAQGTTIRILYSRQDSVLHFAFPPGQALAGRDEASARALGRFGPTPFMPGYNATLTEREIRGAGHGDYWGHGAGGPSRLATEEAGRFLKLGDLGRELGTPRDLGAPSSLPTPREYGIARSLGDGG